MTYTILVQNRNSLYFCNTSITTCEALSTFCLESHLRKVSQTTYVKGSGYKLHHLLTFRNANPLPSSPHNG